MRILRELLLLAIAVAVVLVPGQRYVVKAYRIPSQSMMPTLAVNDRVLTARFLLRFRDPARGEIFVFHPNGSGDDVRLASTASTQNYVKRVVGLPGEVIGSVRGRVYVCAGGRYPADPAAPTATAGCRLLDEPYVHGKLTLSLKDPGSDLEPTVIQPGYYFMMGDNRTNSADSREWGAVPRAQLIGRVFVTYWPLDRLSFP